MTAAAAKQAAYRMRKRYRQLFREEVERFHGMLSDLSSHLEDGDPLREVTAEQLLQGPMSDAMTHTGQLAMLRRLSGTREPDKGHRNIILASHVGSISQEMERKSN